MNEVPRNQIDSGKLFNGLLLIGVGPLFLLDRLGFADFGYVISHFWPLIIVAFGVAKVLRGRVWPGLWMMAIGLWLEAVRMRWFDLHYSTSWPLLLIALGAGMVVRAFFSSIRKDEPHET